MFRSWFLISENSGLKVNGCSMRPLWRYSVSVCYSFRVPGIKNIFETDGLLWSQRSKATGGLQNVSDLEQGQLHNFTTTEKRIVQLNIERRGSKFSQNSRKRKIDYRNVDIPRRHIWYAVLLVVVSIIGYIKLFPIHTFGFLCSWLLKCS